MTLKKRIAFFISLLFTILFGVVAVIILTLFSYFRKEEFRQRLEEKALSTIKLLTEVKQVDKQLLKVIDQNSINRLYNEKTLVFDAGYHLIYTSLDDAKINWTSADLEYLKKHKTFFKHDGEYEVYGVFYDTNNEDYYALISANDNYGKRNLKFLIWLVSAAYVVFVFLAWLLTFYAVRKLFRPLDDLHLKISQINERSLATRIHTNNKSKNEIDLIGTEFNLMMDRIENSYDKQKEFTAQASHELRTPLAKISALVENEMANTEKEKSYRLKLILQNINLISELIDSLLVLSRSEMLHSSSKEKARVDEAIYNSIEKVHAEFNQFKVNLEFDDAENMEELLQVECNQSLLEIAVSNLLKNAFQYSDNGLAVVKLRKTDDHLQLCISNSGILLTEQEKEKLFEPFARGGNSRNKPGLGLGLRIADRILTAYGFSIFYRNENAVNEFVIDF
ncbi:HAMP domain-containing sensor histidine kinase [Pollutibacter soli]|uniref:HAMP domain-containing sensor histidine kinase n=1 Tax=Pollutibacter soli TaxID=3034157 RepID=UPI0030141D0D